MAIDNTPPRLRLIATIATIVVITLIGLDFVFKSYYAYMSDEAQHEKLAPTTAKNEQHTAEAAAFAGAKVPMDQAMAQLKAGRSALVEPKPSEDMGAMTGWSKLPKQAPLPAPGGGGMAPGMTGMHAPDTTGGAAAGGALQADGGTTTAADGGAPATADAGPHAPTPAPKGGAAKDGGARAPH
jgi:hypothetical protein